MGTWRLLRTAPCFRFSTSAAAGGLGVDQAAQGARCVSRYRVIAPDDLSASGRSVEGLATLQGAFASRGSATVGVVGNDLVAFSAQDVSSGCPQTPHAIPYGVQTNLMPLAPIASYASSIWDGSIPRAIVACANGVFVLQKAVASIEDPASILENLLDVDFVVDSRPKGSRGGAICRLSKNVIAVLSSRDDFPSAAIVQRSIGAGPFKDFDEILHTAGPFVISASVLDVSSETTDSVALRRAAPSMGPDTRVLEQPLKSWQTPPLMLHAVVHIYPAGNDLGPSEPIADKFLLHGGAVGVSTTGTHSPLRGPLPGEIPGDLEKQLERIITNVLQEHLGKLPSGAQAQELLDASTKRTAETLRERVDASSLLPTPSAIRMAVYQQRTRGRPVKLPSGLSCLVPEYALDVHEPRLGVVLGTLPALGAATTFTPWTSAEVTGVAVGW